MAGELQRRAAEFRRDLLQLERSAASDMVRAYGASWQRVEARVTQLWQEVQALREAGEAVPPVRLMQLDRYLRLQDEITAELRRFVQYADGSVTATQLAAVDMAQQHAPRLIGAVASDAELAGLEQFVDFAHTPTQAVEALVGFARGNTPLGVLLDAIPNQVNGTVRDTLIAGLALGQNPRETARQVRRAFGTGLARALNISRTETLRAYREATRLEYQANDDILEGWIWSCALDRRSCPVCWAMHGRVFKLQRQMPAHPSCIVGGTLVSAPPIHAVSKRLYDGLVYDIWTVNGHKLTVTPNHPILTDHGWIAAHLLNVGDNVICQMGAESAIAKANPNSQNVPALIEDIVETFTHSRNVSAISVPTSPEQFHGDGAGSQISVVWADGLLQSDSQAAILQPLTKLSFLVSNMALIAFPSLGGFTHTFPRLLATPNGIMSSLSIAEMLFGRALGHRQLVGLNLSTNRNVLFLEPTPDSMTPHFEHTSQLVFRDTGQIEGNEFLIRKGLPSSDWAGFKTAPFQVAIEGSTSDVPTTENFGDWLPGNIVSDSIIKITRREFSGHVYNLETETGWYVANSIITHNCRCSLVPQLKKAYRGDYEPARGPALFAAADPSIQRAVLGPGAFAEYNAGRVSIENFVSFRRSREWGVTVYKASLGTALERARA